jgi:hypothetical protein
MDDEGDDPAAPSETHQSEDNNHVGDSEQMAGTSLDLRWITLPTPVGTGGRGSRFRNTGTDEWCDRFAVGQKHLIVKSIPIFSIETVSHEPLTSDLGEGFDEGVGKQPSACSRQLRVQQERCFGKQSNTLPVSNRPAATPQCTRDMADCEKDPCLATDLGTDRSAKVRWILGHATRRPRPTDDTKAMQSGPPSPNRYYPKMATFDGFELDLNRAGAVLLITEPVKESVHETLPGGVEVRIDADSRVVRANGLDPATDIDGIEEVARGAADLALDKFCLISGGAHLLTDPESMAIAWTGNGSDCLMRVYSEALMEFSARATATVADAAGHAVAQRPPAPAQWHESMRYFRMSQTTDDLLDSFRNIYLALESVLSEIDPHRKVPPIGRWESEKTWFKRALTTAEGIMQKHGGFQTLSQRFDDRPPPVNPVNAIFKDLYATARTATFHAKSGRTVSLPQRQTDRQEVARVLQRYAGLFADVAEARFGTRFLRSGIGPAFTQGMKGVLEQLTVGLSSNSYPDKASVDAARPEEFIGMATEISLKHAEPFAVSILGTISPADLPLDYEIRGFGAFDSEDVHFATDLEGTLRADGVKRLEHLMKVRAAGRAFKRRYKT